LQEAPASLTYGPSFVPNCFTLTYKGKTMYTLHLRNGKRITSAVLQHTLSNLDCGPLTHTKRMQHLSAIERLEARGMQHSNQDFDVLSAALNFLDAVHPDHDLRG
jgi:hypothetical protein